MIYKIKDTTHDIFKVKVIKTTFWFVYYQYLELPLKTEKRSKLTFYSIFEKVK